MNPKFNAWDEETKHMYLAGNDHVVLDSDGTCYNLQTGNKLIPLFWTGKQDKDGQDLFNHDLVRRYVLSNDDPAYEGCFDVYEIVWSYVFYGFTLIEGSDVAIHLMSEYDDLIKIGNILEQPELLNG